MNDHRSKTLMACVSLPVRIDVFSALRKLEAVAQIVAKLRLPELPQRFREGRRCKLRAKEDRQNDHDS